MGHNFAGISLRLRVLPETILRKLDSSKARGHSRCQELHMSGMREGICSKGKTDMEIIDDTLPVQMVKSVI